MITNESSRTRIPVDATADPIALPGPAEMAVRQGFVPAPTEQARSGVPAAVPKRERSEAEMAVRQGFEP
jgi:hypothetical protein